MSWISLHCVGYFEYVMMLIVFDFFLSNVTQSTIFVQSIKKTTFACVKHLRLPPTYEVKTFKKKKKSYDIYRLPLNALT